MQEFFEQVAKINDSVNAFVWVTIGIVLLFGTGVIMTVLTKFFQVTHFAHWWKNTIGSIFKKHVKAHTNEKGVVSQFQALCTALAATVGVGNIAGVAAAITVGGPGAIFWMWVAAFFGMMTNYSENVLGVYFRRRNADGEWSGGAMYYLQDGLGSHKGCKTLGKVLAILFSVFCILASFGIGNMGQVNKIVANLENAFRIDALSGVVLYEDVSLYALILGIVLMLLTALVVIGGLKRIATVAEKIVPVMVVLFITGSLVIIGIHYNKIGAAFGAIFANAFRFSAVWGGATGVAFKTVITQGFKRGIFSNEAGLGSSVMVHSNSNVKEPVKQGMWGIFEVFADTIIICTMTALVVLTSGVIDLQTGALAANVTDATMVSAAFETVFGALGGKFVALCILLFAYTTVLGWSHYGSKGVEYLGGVKAVAVYRVIFVLMIMSGALMTSSLAWDISDTFNGLMMIPNLIGVLSCSVIVVKLTNNYVNRILKHRDIEPMLSYDPKIQAEMLARLHEDDEA